MALTAEGDCTMRAFQPRIAVVAIGILTLLLFSADLFAQSRGACKGKADQTMADLDKWIGEYEGQMSSAEPVQKAKYEEWINELKKLKTLVAQAKEKLANKEQCSSEECVKDQCSLVDIADQQVAQLIKETEEQLGSGTRFGEEGGRDVVKDAGTLGDDTMLAGTDPNDAGQPTIGEESETSDNPTDGGIGNVFPDAGVDSGLSTENPKDEASAQ